MKRVIIIGRQHVVEKNDSKELAERLKNADFAVDYAYLEECVVAIADDIQITAQVHGTAHDLADYDLAILMGWSGARTLSDLAHTIALYLEDKGKVCWNSELVHARSMTKLSQLYRAKRIGVPVSHSVFSLQAELLADAVAHTLTTDKVVVKDVEASRGRRNELTAKAGIADTLRQYAGYPMIAQDFIPNDGSDLRIIVAGGKAVLALLRRGSGDTHLTNTSQGGQATNIPLKDLPPELLAQSAAVAQAFHRELCGIDFMANKTTGQYIFLEINMIPQLVTGAFIDDKISSLRNAIYNTLQSQEEA